MDQGATEARKRVIDDIAVSSNPCGAKARTEVNDFGAPAFSKRKESRPFAVVAGGARVRFAQVHASVGS